MGIDCRCEPCPIDLRRRGWRTSKEDPAFEGTQCLWHEQIRGPQGFIYPSSADMVVVEITDARTRRAIGWERDEREQESKSARWEPLHLTKAVPIPEIDHYATLIGARR